MLRLSAEALVEVPTPQSPSLLVALLVAVLTLQSPRLLAVLPAALLTLTRSDGTLLTTVGQSAEYCRLFDFKFYVRRKPL